MAGDKVINQVLDTTTATNIAVIDIASSDDDSSSNNHKIFRVSKEDHSKKKRKTPTLTVVPSPLHHKMFGVSKGNDKKTKTPIVTLEPLPHHKKMFGVSKGGDQDHCKKPVEPLPHHKSWESCGSRGRSAAILEAFSAPQNASSSKSKASPLPESFCGICMDTKMASEMFRNINVCGHLFCLDCIRSHVATKIKENITRVKCPDPNCKGEIGPELCRSIVPKEVLDRWEDLLSESVILASQKFYCPFKDCSAMMVDDGGQEVTSAECPNCNRLFCAQCKVAWHSGMSCGEFQVLDKRERDPGDLLLMELAKNKEWKRCPKCRFFVEKTSGCLHISCRCGYQFCYGCGQDYNGGHACPPRLN